MIDIALTLLRDELQNYMDPAGAVVNVDIDNIGLLETASGASLAKKVIISLVNLEEKAPSKIIPQSEKGRVSG